MEGQEDSDYENDMEPQTEQTGQANEEQERMRQVFQNLSLRSGAQYSPRGSPVRSPSRSPSPGRGQQIESLSSLRELLAQALPPESQHSRSGRPGSGGGYGSPTRMELDPTLAGFSGGARGNLSPIREVISQEERGHVPNLIDLILGFRQTGRMPDIPNVRDGQMNEGFNGLCTEIEYLLEEDGDAIESLKEDGIEWSEEVKAILHQILETLEEKMRDFEVQTRLRIPRAPPGSPRTPGTSPRRSPPHTSPIDPELEARRRRYAEDNARRRRELADRTGALPKRANIPPAHRLPPLPNIGASSSQSGSQSLKRKRDDEEEEMEVEEEDRDQTKKKSKKGKSRRIDI